MQKLQFQKKSNTKVWLSCFLNGLVLSLGVIAILLGGFFATHSHFKIIGSSMEPTISGNGFSCYVQNNASFTHGDIVVAFDTTVHSAPVIKRVIAMGGDLVGFYYNNNPQNFANPYFQVLLVKNGETATLLDEKYLYYGIEDNTAQNQLLENNFTAYQKFITLPNLQDYTFNGQTVQVLPLSENQVFLLGDNRQVSKDSSSYGAVNITCVKGKVSAVFADGTPPITIALKHIFGF